MSTPITIQDLLSTLTAMVSGTNFRLTAANVAGLESTDVTALLAMPAVVPGGTLDISGVKTPLVLTTDPEFGQVITLSGTLATPVVGLGPVDGSAAFYLDSTGVAQVRINYPMAPGWTLAKTFTAMKGTTFGDAEWTSARFLGASVKKGPIVAGLNFGGVPDANSVLFLPIKAFLNRPNSIFVAGAATLPGAASGVPAIAAESAAMTSDIHLGRLNPSITVSANAKAGAKGAAEGDLDFAASLPFPGNSGALSLGTKIFGGGAPINITGKFVGAQPSLTDLDAVNSGSSFSHVLPPRLPIGDVLDSVSVTISVIVGTFSKTATIGKVTAEVTLAKDDGWTIIPDVLGANNIDVQFTVANPFSGPQVSASASADFNMSAVSAFETD